MSQVEEQLTLHELMQDKIFASWMDKEPSVEGIVVFGGKPWRVWIQRKASGPWGFRDFKRWRKARKFLRKHMDAGCHDAALCSKVKSFQPPVVSDKKLKRKRHHIPRFPGMNAQHKWCPHCRRPTIFTTFKRHHAFSRPPMSYVRRCAICGISVTGIKVYK